MLTLIIGGSASGKSEYAENHMLSLDGKRVYLATMEPFGDEGRIARHREKRSGRGFLTVECYTDLRRTELPERANVLLEDLGNLTANELFSPAGGGPAGLRSGLEDLMGRCRHLTVVTNEIFSGGRDYAGDTLSYMRELARVNIWLASRADLAVEVVCGLPNVLKEAKA